MKYITKKIEGKLEIKNKSVKKTGKTKKDKTKRRKEIKGTEGK
jgi:hypothetical protein